MHKLIFCLTFIFDQCHSVFLIDQTKFTGETLEVTSILVDNKTSTAAAIATPILTVFKVQGCCQIHDLDIVV